MKIEEFQGCFIITYKQFTAVSEELADAIACIFMQMRSSK